VYSAAHDHRHRLADDLGYVTDNLLAACEALPLTAADVVRPAENGARASFMSESARDELLARIRKAASG
jgi:adenosine deaminase